MSYVGKAVEVFLNTGTRFPRRMIWAIGLVKYSAAKANVELGLLDEARAEAIMRASLEVAEGLYDGRIVVDVFQTGSGTGFNMNVNEVVAERASQISGLKVHPNDHVNMGQSSNDVVPTAVRVALAYELGKILIPCVEGSIEALLRISEKTRNVVKPGRTHLRDALPVTMGQEFSAYADALSKDKSLLENVLEILLEVPLGGTAVGTGLNAHPRYAEIAVKTLAEATGLNLKPSASTFRAMRLLSDVAAASSAMKVLALDLWRLSQDLRLMYSGPYTGLGEVDIPQEVPGSSIMPGKVNPVTVEAVMQAASHVIGLDQTVTIASLLGEFELSMGIPLAGYATLTQTLLLKESLDKLSTLVLERVKPLEERARWMAERSQALITIIAPIVGYEKAAEISRKLYEGKSVREALLELGFSDEEVKTLLDMEKLTKPGIPALELKKPGEPMSRR